MVVATKPGTSVQVKVLRNKQEKTLNVVVDELDLDAEQNQGRRRAAERLTGGAGTAGHGQLRPDARTGDAADGAAAAAAVGTDRARSSPKSIPTVRRPARWRQGDVILSVNGKEVTNAADAARELQKIQVGTPRAAARLARRQGDLRAGEERMRLRLQIADCRLQIADLIHERGPLTVAAFMDLALYDPALGYYARAAQRSGRAGDFFTSVDVGSLFGELLEVQLAEMHEILQTSDFRLQTFDLVEAGAGNGRLSADILRAAKAHHPELLRRDPSAPGRSQRGSAARAGGDARRRRRPARHPPARRFPNRSRACSSPTSCSTRCRSIRS